MHIIPAFWTLSGKIAENLRLALATYWDPKSKKIKLKKEKEENFFPMGKVARAMVSSKLPLYQIKSPYPMMALFSG